VSNDQSVATREFTLPTDFPLGHHEVEASGTMPDGSSASVSTGLEVVAADATGSDPGDEDLARTGSNSGALVRIAVLLVAGGAALLLAGRKRASRASSPG